MRAVERLRRLLESHGIYDQAVKLMRQHVREAGEEALSHAPLVGASTILSMIPVGGKFKFPRSDEVYIKVSPIRYQTEDGRQFSTGRNVGVLKVE